MKLAALNMIFFLIAISFLSPARGAIRTTGHQEYSAQLTRAIDWTKHIVAEVKRGKKINHRHVAREIRDTVAALSDMQEALAIAVSEAPSESTDSHMQHLRQHQKIAQEKVSVIQALIGTKSPNYFLLNESSQELLGELKKLQHWHELELSEQEIKFSH